MKPQTGILHRFFFALVPDIVTARRTDLFAEALAGGARRLPIAHQHMTLTITNDYEAPPPDLVTRLRKAADSVIAPPFDLTLDQLAVGNRSAALRPGRRVPALFALQGRLASAMRAVDVPMRIDYRFSPHATLFYRRGRPDNRPVPGFLWQVRHFVLIHSEVGRTRHNRLGCWPLTSDSVPDGQLALKL